MNYLDFLAGWQQVAFILIFVALAAALVNYIVYKVQFSTKKTLKEKFDLVSMKETKAFLASHVLIAVSLFFFNNTLVEETVAISPIWFFIRIFIAGCIGLLYGYVAHLVLKFYYPAKLDRKLKRLRYTPRTNPTNGLKMKLLSEEEEDAYLDEGMQAEENVFSVDYDVWIDEATGYTKIEKYKGHLNALKCDRCGFQTLRLSKEEIIHEATETEDGELLKEYTCTYCGRIKRKSVVLSRKIKDRKENAVLISDPLSQDPHISVIKVEVHLRTGEVKEFDFSNLDQAKNFMNQFNLESLEEEVYS